MTSVEIDETFRINEDARLAAGKNRIALSRGIDLHRIRHPRAAALFDKEAQAPFGRGKIFFLEQLEEVLCGGFGDYNHLRQGEFVSTIRPGTHCPK